MKAMFTMGAVRQYMQDRVDAYEEKVIEALRYEGENFVTRAKEKQPKSLATGKPEDGSFNDRTANLRSSIGYIILKDGEEVDSLFEGEKSKGITQGKKAAKEVASQYPTGFVLIGVAGMDYAAAVESKGFDVITGSAPTAQSMRDLLGSIKIN